MHYHSPRVVHVLQNRTLGHWPTAHLRQLIMSDIAECLVLHFHARNGLGRILFPRASFRSHDILLVAANATGGLLA